MIVKKGLTYRHCGTFKYFFIDIYPDQAEVKWQNILNNEYKLECVGSNHAIKMDKSYRLSTSHDLFI